MTFETDVLVVGSGPSGIGAAVGAADSGARVTLLEKLSYPGGRATASAVGTICGAFFRGNNVRFAVNGFPKMFIEKIIFETKREPLQFSEKLWFLPCQPADFKLAAESFLANKNIQPLFNSTISSIEMTGNKISRVIFQQENQEFSIQAKTVIDCSGNGIVLQLTNHTVMLPENHQASALVFSLNSVEAENEFNLRHLLIKYISKNILEGNIPEHYNLLSIVPGSLIDKSLLLKQGLPWNPIHENDPKELEAEKLVREIFQFLKSNIPSFKNSIINWIAEETGYRSGPRPVGRDILTEVQLLSCIKKDNSICNGVWPIEYWHVGNNRVDMTYFPENDYYSIPAGCLISTEVRNLFFAGKLISATDRAIASARVIATCLATGYSAGVLAAFRSQNKLEEHAIKMIRSRMLDSI